MCEFDAIRLHCKNEVEVILTKNYLMLIELMDSYAKSKGESLIFEQKDNDFYFENKKNLNLWLKYYETIKDLFIK